METFIGMGHNPDGPDIPMGLGMQLAQDPKAMRAFGKMTDTQKSELISYLQGAGSGEEAKERMAVTLNRLRDSDSMPGTNFFS